ncbi:Isocitrate dehydrogenase [NAD] subunit beta, mitochondrial [Armadillidium vulgare]|nr:Isocitrate dehydrogenase [NAD] subunit beta, mitochondrial [Armadillidium vulgare]
MQATAVSNAQGFHSLPLLSTAQGIPVSKPEGRTTCAMIPGDGVGPELCQVVIEVFKAAGVPVDFEEHFLTELYPQRSAPLDMVVESITRNGICLKGILASPDYSAEGDLKTLNMKLRDSLDLYANVVHVKSLPGLNVRHKNVDMVVIREQTEGEYSALEHETIEGVIECLKIMTREKCQRIAKFAFDYATKNNRNRVTAVHKANIMKLGDGLFLKCCEEGARHTFSEAVGKNVANPTAMLLCATKMLRHVNLQYFSDLINNAVYRVIKTGKVKTKDMGGYSKTHEFMQAVVANLHH